MSQRNTPTEAGDINRKTSEEKGRENSGTGAEFGQSIGRSEHLDEGEGGSMNRDRNKNQSNIDENESSRRPSGESGYGSSSGRSRNVGDSGEISGNMDQGSSRSGSRRGDSGSMENDDSSSGRH